MFMNLPKMNFTVLDTETTGLIPRTNRVIEFASVRVEGGSIVDEYEQLFTIQEEIPPVTRVLTRIRSEHLEGKHTLKEKREEILSHIGTHTVILGQNVGFDIAMLKGEGIDLSDRPWIDTSMIASLAFPELESYSLGYMSQVLKLNHQPVHRALGDVHATLELIERFWKRLQELPEELLDITQEVSSRSTPAYNIFFSALPASTKKKIPVWLKTPKSKKQAPKKSKVTNTKLQKPVIGVVDLVEEPLEPDFLQGVINACSEDASTVHWIAVKNLESTIRRLAVPKNARILYPPFLLPDRNAVERLAKQETFTADEATLTMKLAWYEPAHHGQVPIHGDERSVWHGKIACTDASETYIQQFDRLPSTLIIDHRQLLAFLANTDLMTKEVFGENPHIIVDDASMLEDTATKAYGWFCSIENLRAGVAGDTQLTRFTDVLELWTEKLRAFQDTHMVTLGDLRTPETRGLREQLQDLLTTELSEQCRSILFDLKHILDPDRLSGRITWIEQYAGKSPFLQSVPEYISEFLKNHLYGRFPTTLLVPPKSSNTLREIIPPGITSKLSITNYKLSLSVPVLISEKTAAESTLQNPPSGKSIILMSGKNAIEKCFIEYTEVLETKGVSLFCQGFGGGHDRLQAEFLAAPSGAILVLSPWRYESTELPENTVHQLFITSLPFDSPSNPVFAHRSEHYHDSFMEYSLPRLEHRLFRMLRTFCRHKTEHGEVYILDERVRTRKYGVEIQKYLEKTSGRERDAKRDGQLNMF